MKIEDCEGTRFANLQSSGGGSVIKRFFKKINVVGLKIEDCEGTLLANLQSSGGGPVIKKFVIFF